MLAHASGGAYASRVPAAPHASARSGIVAAGIRKSFGPVDALPTTDLWAPAGEVTVLEGRTAQAKRRCCASWRRSWCPMLARRGSPAWICAASRASCENGSAWRSVNERSLWWRLTGRQNLELFGRIRGLGRRDRRAQVGELLEELGLTGLGDRPVHALSAGQRQRIVLGRALVGAPAALLIDEPLRGLDPDAADLVLDALRARAHAGAAVLVATPSMVEYAGLADARRERVGASAANPCRRGERMSSLRIALALAAKDLRVAWSYRLSFVFGHVAGFGSVLVFYFVSRVVANPSRLARRRSTSASWWWAWASRSLWSAPSRPRWAPRAPIRCRHPGIRRRPAVRASALGFGWLAFPITDALIGVGITFAMALPLGLWA